MKKYRFSDGMVITANNADEAKQQHKVISVFQVNKELPLIFKVRKTGDNVDISFVGHELELDPIYFISTEGAEKFINNNIEEFKEFEKALKTLKSNKIYKMMLS